MEHYQTADDILRMMNVKWEAPRKRMVLARDSRKPGMRSLVSILAPWIGIGGLQVCMDSRTKVSLIFCLVAENPPNSVSDISQWAHESSWGSICLGQVARTQVDKKLITPSEAFWMTEFARPPNFSRLSNLRFTDGLFVYLERYCNNVGYYKAVPPGESEIDRWVLPL